MPHFQIKQWTVNTYILLVKNANLGDKSDVRAFCFVTTVSHVRELLKMSSEVVSLKEHIGDAFWHVGTHGHHTGYSYPRGMPSVTPKSTYQQNPLN